MVLCPPPLYFSHSVALSFSLEEIYVLIFLEVINLVCRSVTPATLISEDCLSDALCPCRTYILIHALYVPPFSSLKSAEEEDDAGYLDVAVSEVKHPPPQLSPMPEGLTSHQVRLTAAQSQV